MLGIILEAYTTASIDLQSQVGLVMHEVKRPLLPCAPRRGEKGRRRLWKREGGGRAAISSCVECKRAGKERMDFIDVTSGWGEEWGETAKGLALFPGPPYTHTHSHLTNSRYGRWQQMVCRYFFWSNPTTKRPIGEKRWVSLRLLLLLSLGKTDQSSGPGEWHTFFILVDRITPPSSALLSGQIFPCLTSLPEKRALFSWSLLAQ